jgi:hypothetical protein
MVPDSNVLDALSLMEVFHQKVGACLYQKGEKPTTAFWLRKGVVELVPTVGPTRLVRAPALLGAELLNDPVCHHTVRILHQEGPTIVCPIDLSILRNKCEHDFRFRLGLLRLLSQQAGSE